MMLAKESHKNASKDIAEDLVTSHYASVTQVDLSSPIAIALPPQPDGDVYRAARDRFRRHRLQRLNEGMEKDRLKNSVKLIQ